MDKRKRKRGVRASREKLEAAMLSAGYETQMTLAKQIALDEGLDKPPKDLVNKIFREQAVSTHNLARIAKALRVEAHTIYLAKDDSEFEEVVDIQSIPSEHSYEITEEQIASSTSSFTLGKKNFIIYLAGLFALSLSLYYVFFSAPIVNNPVTTKIVAPLGKVRIVVQAPEDFVFSSTAIISALNANPNITAILASSSTSYPLSSTQALDKWQTHAVLTLRYKQHEFYTQTTAIINSRESEATLLQALLHNSERKLAANQTSLDIALQVERFINGEVLREMGTTSAQAFDNYAQGKEILFLAHSANAYQQAIDYFTQAISKDANFALGYAELCRTYLRFSWVQDESTLLEKAATYCETANQLASHAMQVVSANAELLARTGEPEKALALVENAIPISLTSADAMAIRASIHLTMNGQAPSDEHSQLSEQFALKALELVPMHWHAFNTLGNLYFSSGQIQQAKEQFASASKIVKHEVILANLGTLQLCFGELDNAKNTFIDVITNFDNNYLGYENLGSIYFFQQDNEKALEQKSIAIKKQPDLAIHQVWSGLAEVYLQLQKTEEALNYYGKALTLIERDELLDNVTIGDRLHKLYYQIKISQLSRSFVVSPKFKDQVRYFINAKNNLGLKERSHLAWLSIQAESPAQGLKLWQEISETCPVYKLSPELLAQPAYGN